MSQKIYCLLAALGLILVALFFSFRLRQTPPGLTIDEASIGYNAVLLGKDLHDESGRFLPFFPLTINGKDWKQPITMYTTVIFFKVFGASLTTLRLVSVFAGIVSLVLLVYLGAKLLGLRGGLVAGILFVTAPMTLLHTHLAQENIMPIPFTLLWLTGLYLFSRNKKPWSLILSGLSLGLGLYSYKGMRAIVPVWAVISVGYLFFSELKDISLKSLISSVKKSLPFILTFLPFVLIIPWLNVHYAGAVFEPKNLETKSFYDFIYPYLSSFDLSALFLKGDSTPWHSTGIHGVFLLATLPLFIFGLIKSARQNSFWIFLLICFLSTPLLFGQVGSVYRFSRLLVFVPFFSLFAALGFQVISQSKASRFLLPAFLLLFTVNFVDFVHYYWFQYPSVEQSNFLANHEDAFIQLKQLSQEKNLRPYIFVDDMIGEGEVGKFYEAAYFPNSLGRWKPGDTLPDGSIVMTRLKTQPSMTSLGNTSEFNFLSN